MIWSSLWPFVLFTAGVVVVIWATERLLESLIRLAGLLRVSTFAVAASRNSRPMPWLVASLRRSVLLEP